jgi:hypothetical protein
MIKNRFKWEEYFDKGTFIRKAIEIRNFVIMTIPRFPNINTVIAVITRQLIY